MCCCERTQEATVPRAIMLTIGAVGVTGYAFIMALTFVQVGGGTGGGKWGGGRSGLRGAGPCERHKAAGAGAGAVPFSILPPSGRGAAAAGAALAPSTQHPAERAKHVAVCVSDVVAWQCALGHQA